MTRKQIFGGIAVVAAGVIIAGALTFAQRGPGGGERGPGHRFDRGMGSERMFGALDLTTQQRDQVKSIVEQHRAELQAAGETVVTARRAQREAITASPFDESTVRARAADSAAAEADMAVLRAKVRSEVVEILTPDQRTKLQELETNRRNRVGDWLEHWRERRQSVQPPAL